MENMKLIKFKTVSDYITSIIENLTLELQDDNSITQNVVNEDGTITKAFNYVIFNDMGSYHKTFENPKTINKTEYPEILILIRNGGILKDTTTREMQMYRQGISIEVLGWEDEQYYNRQQKNDLLLIFNMLSNIYYIYDTELEGITVQVNIDEMYTFTPLENKRFRINLNMSFTAFGNTNLADDWHFFIDNQEIPILAFDISTNAEKTFDNRKTEVIKSFKNNTLTQLTLMGPILNDNGKLNELIEDSIKIAPANKNYIIELRVKDNVIKTWTMYILNSKVNGTIGSVNAYNFTFLESSGNII